MQPAPDAVTACRYVRSCTSPAWKTPGILVRAPPCERMYPSASVSICPLKILVLGMCPMATKKPSTSCSQTSPVLTFRRSEEHTSELQSLRHLVCRLLLEKKKT